jgi:hypothetical protein
VQGVGSNSSTTVTKIIRAKGASFEHYEMEGMRREGDIHIGGGMKLAWLKDPTGIS